MLENLVRIYGIVSIVRFCLGLRVRIVGFVMSVCLNLLVVGVLESEFCFKVFFGLAGLECLGISIGV